MSWTEITRPQYRRDQLRFAQAKATRKDNVAALCPLAPVYYR
jgi:hypothetical protein